jgi:hypothetical protein
MSAPPTFQEAVEIAHAYLSKGKDEGAFDSALAWKTLVNFSAAEFFGEIKTTGAGGVEVKDFAEMLKVGEPQEIIEIESSFEPSSSDPKIPIEQMISRAENNAANFDILAVIAAAYIDAGVLMPKALGQWAMAVLRGEKKRPARHGKFAEGTGLRNLHIWEVTRILVKRGMTATRNDVSPATSACDAVAEALMLLGESPTSYASVKRIWNDFQR